MLQYIGVSGNPAVLERIRRWLTDTYGCSVSRCVETLTEVASLCITNPGVRAIITDLPPGRLLHKLYDEAALITKGAKIIVIYPSTSDIFVPSGERNFTVVPEGRLRWGLDRALHVH
ncbi:MAG: hypothetical protein Q8O51_01955 [bacterium]|nr:hypothetical protein [bacterium]